MKLDHQGQDQQRLSGELADMKSMQDELAEKQPSRTLGGSDPVLPGEGKDSDDIQRDPRKGIIDSSIVFGRVG